MRHEPGIYYDVPRETYDEIDAVNWSTLKHFSRSPLHVLEALRAKQRDTDAMRFGRAEHLAVLEPQRFDSEVAVWRGADRRTKEGKAEWAAFEKAHAGKEILDDEEHRKCILIARAVRANPTAAKYLSGGRAEVTVLWNHNTITGESIPCKSRLDYVGGALVDLKSTQSASPGAFGRQCWNLGYHGQSALYLDSYVIAGGQTLPVVLIAVEKEPPFAVAVYVVPRDVLERGRATYSSYLDRLAVCRATSHWPSYGESELELSLPVWTNNLNDGVAQ